MLSRAAVIEIQRSSTGDINNAATARLFDAMPVQTQIRRAGRNCPCATDRHIIYKIIVARRARKTVCACPGRCKCNSIDRDNRDLRCFSGLSCIIPPCPDIYIIGCSVGKTTESQCAAIACFWHRINPVRCLVFRDNNILII